MSTKSSIAHGDNFHLYNEVFDDNFVYLELEGVQFEAAYNRVMVPIPMHIWEVIRQYPGIDLELAGKTDAEIGEFVEREVDERIKKYDESRERGGSLIRILGGLVYGMADEPREKQVESGIEYFGKQRDHQDQIKEAILRLKSEQRPPDS